MAKGKTLEKIREALNEVRRQRESIPKDSKADYLLLGQQMALEFALSTIHEFERANTGTASNPIIQPGNTLNQ